MERFLCDEMLARLCRYLRAAGYDAALATNGSPDHALLRQCREEARRFLTLDRRIPEHKAAAGIVVILPNDQLDEQAQVLTRAFGLDWLARAFTPLSCRQHCAAASGRRRARTDLVVARNAEEPVAAFRAAVASTGAGRIIGACASACRRGSGSASPACAEEPFRPLLFVCESRQLIEGESDHQYSGPSVERDERRIAQAWTDASRQRAQQNPPQAGAEEHAEHRSRQRSRGRARRSDRDRRRARGRKDWSSDWQGSARACRRRPAPIRLASITAAAGRGRARNMRTPSQTRKRLAPNMNPAPMCDQEIGHEGEAERGHRAVDRVRPRRAEPRSEAGPEAIGERAPETEHPDRADGCGHDDTDHGTLEKEFGACSRRNTAAPADRS